MNIPKAIEILQLQTNLTSPNLDPDLIAANKLGIEALKRIQACREPEGGSPLPPLLGETKGGDNEHS